MTLLDKLTTRKVHGSGFQIGSFFRFSSCSWFGNCSTKYEPLFSCFNKNIKTLIFFSLIFLYDDSKTGDSWDSLFEICFIFQVKSCKSSKYKADVISSAGKMNVTQAGGRNASKISYCQLARSSVPAFLLTSRCWEMKS